MSVEYLIIHCPFLQGEVAILTFEVDINGQRTYSSANDAFAWNKDLVDLQINYRYRDENDPAGQQANEDATLLSDFRIERASDPDDRINGVAAFRTLDSVLELLDTSNGSDFAKPIIEQYKVGPWKDMSFFDLKTASPQIGVGTQPVRLSCNTNTWLNYLTDPLQNYEIRNNSLGPRLDQCSFDGKKSFKLPVCSDRSEFKDLTKDFLEANLSSLHDHATIGVPAQTTDLVDGVASTNCELANLNVNHEGVKRLVEARTEMSKYFNILHIKGVTPAFRFQVNLYQYNEYYYSDEKQRLNEYRGPVGNTKKRYKSRNSTCENEFEQSRYKRSRRNY